MNELRCFCSRKPLLAVGGTDAKTHQPFLHIKSMRGEQIKTEVVVTEGVVRIHCTQCFRWHTVKIVKNEVFTRQEELPSSIVLAS